MGTILFRGVAAASLALTAGAALAQDAAGDSAAFGPAFGSNRYVASIAASATTPDVDDYVSSLLAYQVPFLSKLFSTLEGRFLVEPVPVPGPWGLLRVRERAPP